METASGIGTTGQRNSRAWLFRKGTICSPSPYLAPLPAHQGSNEGTRIHRSQVPAGHVPCLRAPRLRGLPARHCLAYEERADRSWPTQAKQAGAWGGDGETKSRCKTVGEYLAQAGPRSRDRFEALRALLTALAGNVVMRIWLGKQYLGQSDRQTTEATLLPEVRKRLRRLVAAIPRERLGQITGRPLPLPARAAGVAERGAPHEASRASSW